MQQFEPVNGLVLHFLSKGRFAQFRKRLGVRQDGVVLNLGVGENRGV